MAAPDEYEPTAVGGLARPVLEGGLEPVQVRDQRLGRELDHPRRRAQRVGQSRLERAEVDAVGTRHQSVEGQAVRVGAELLAVGTGPQHEVEQPLGPVPRFQRGQDLVRIASVERTGLVADGVVDQPADGEIVDDGRVGRRRPCPGR